LYGYFYVSLIDNISSKMCSIGKGGSYLRS